LQISQESDINKKLELMDAIAKMKVKEWYHGKEKRRSSRITNGIRYWRSCWN
jgi:hypothetical protein